MRTPQGAQKIGDTSASTLKEKRDSTYGRFTYLQPRCYAAKVEVSKLLLLKENSSREKAPSHAPHEGLSCELSVTGVPNVGSLQIGRPSGPQP